MENGQHPPSAHLADRPRLAAVESIGTAIIGTVAAIEDDRCRDVAEHVAQVGFAVAGMLTRSAGSVLDTAKWSESFDHLCDEHIYAAMLLLATVHVTGAAGEVAILSQTLSTVRTIHASKG